MSEQFSRFAAATSVGDVVDGRVSRVESFGAFVRVGDVDGFLPGTPAATVGSVIRARVVAIDPEQERFALETA